MLRLPEELRAHIAAMLDARSALALGSTCSQMSASVSQDVVWRVLHARRWGATPRLVGVGGSALYRIRHLSEAFRRWLGARPSSVRGTGMIGLGKKFDKARRVGRRTRLSRRDLAAMAWELLCARDNSGGCNDDNENDATTASALRHLKARRRDVREMLLGALGYYDFEMMLALIRHRGEGDFCACSPALQNHELFESAFRAIAESGSAPWAVRLVGQAFRYAVLGVGGSRTASLDDMVRSWVALALSRVFIDPRLSDVAIEARKNVALSVWYHRSGAAGARARSGRMDASEKALVLDVLFSAARVPVECDECGTRADTVAEALLACADVCTAEHVEMAVARIEAAGKPSHGTVLRLLDELPMRAPRSEMGALVPEDAERTDGAPSLLMTLLALLLSGVPDPGRAPLVAARVRAAVPQCRWLREAPDGRNEDGVWRALLSRVVGILDAALGTRQLERTLVLATGDAPPPYRHQQPNNNNHPAVVPVLLAHMAMISARASDSARLMSKALDSSTRAGAQMAVATHVARTIAGRTDWRCGEPAVSRALVRMLDENRAKGSRAREMGQRTRRLSWVLLFAGLFASTLAPPPLAEFDPLSRSLSQSPSLPPSQPLSQSPSQSPSLPPSSSQSLHVPLSRVRSPRISAAKQWRLPRPRHMEGMGWRGGHASAVFWEGEGPVPKDDADVGEELLWIVESALSRRIDGGREDGVGHAASLRAARVQLITRLLQFADDRSSAVRRLAMWATEMLLALASDPQLVEAAAGEWGGLPHDTRLTLARSLAMMARSVGGESAERLLSIERSAKIARVLGEAAERTSAAGAEGCEEAVGALSILLRTEAGRAEVVARIRAEGGGWLADACSGGWRV
jgi:hypothetical protein